MKSFSSGSWPMYLLLTISLLPIAYIVDRFISPFSKPNIQLVTVMAPSQLCWSVLFLSPFGHCPRWSTSHFAMNLLVAKFLQPVLWAFLLCCRCCTAILLQITSAKRPMKDTWAAWLCLQQDPGFAASLSATSIPLLTGGSSRQDHCTSAYTPAPSSSSPAVPKHHQSPTDCVGVAATDQDQPPLPIKSNNDRHKELWKKLLFNVQKVYIQVQHVTSVLMM